MKNSQESFSLPTAPESDASSFVSNPKIAKLREILLGHFASYSTPSPQGFLSPTLSSESTEGTRVIVFVAYRATAADIVRELSNTTGASSISVISSLSPLLTPLPRPSYRSVYWTKEFFSNSEFKFKLLNRWTQRTNTKRTKGNLEFV
jgi:hypothetical protein